LAATGSKMELRLPPRAWLMGCALAICHIRVLFYWLAALGRSCRAATSPHSTCLPRERNWLRGHRESSFISLFLFCLGRKNRP
jgi:hypothetical protein